MLQTTPFEKLHAAIFNENEGQIKTILTQAPYSLLDKDERNNDAFVIAGYKDARDGTDYVTLLTEHPAFFKLSRELRDNSKNTAYLYMVCWFLYTAHDQPINDDNTASIAHHYLDKANKYLIYLKKHVPIIQKDLYEDLFRKINPLYNLILKRWLQLRSFAVDNTIEKNGESFFAAIISQLTSDENNSQSFPRDVKTLRTETLRHIEEHRDFYEPYLDKAVDSYLKTKKFADNNLESIYKPDVAMILAFALRFKVILFILDGGISRPTIYRPKELANDTFPTVYLYHDAKSDVYYSLVIDPSLTATICIKREVEKTHFMNQPDLHTFKSTKKRKNFRVTETPSSLRFFISNKDESTNKDNKPDKKAKHEPVAPVLPQPSP